MKTKKNDRGHIWLWLGGISALIVVIFLVIILPGLLSKPGPSYDVPVCVLDEQTIYYIATSAIGGADSFEIDVTNTIRVGQKGSPFERLESLTPYAGDIWKATYINIVTGETASQILDKCKDK